MDKVRVGLLLLLMWGAGSGLGRAQSLEIAPFGGWQFGGGFGVSEGSVKINADVVYGVMIDVRVREDGHLEFLYSRQETTLEVSSTDFLRPGKEHFDLNVEYFQGGGVFEFQLERRALRPFVVLTAGATRFSPGLPELETEWRFSLGGGGGIKVFLSERLGLRFDARASPTFLSGGSTFFCSLPGGCLFGLNTATSWQGSATGGVVLAF